MNERFAADPDCFSNAAELKILLDKFGLYTGRYLAQFPNDWETRLLIHLASLPPLQTKRVISLLQRAKEHYGLIRTPGLPWLESNSWAENAGKLTAPPSPKFDGLVVQNGTTRLPFKAMEFDEFDLPPTAEELIVSSPQEYTRVSKLLLLASYELILVDPYLNPCNRFVAPVIEALLVTAGGGSSKCALFKCYARASNILKEYSVNQVKSCLRSLLEEAGVNKPFKIIYSLLDDSRSQVRMHDRYLCSVKGGIQFSQGFQKQRANGKITASPISKLVHKDIWKTFFDGHHDMRVEYCFSVNVA